MSNDQTTMTKTKPLLVIQFLRQARKMVYYLSFVWPFE